MTLAAGTKILFNAPGPWVEGTLVAPAADGTWRVHLDEEESTIFGHWDGVVLADIIVDDEAAWAGLCRVHAPQGTLGWREAKAILEAGGRPTPDEEAIGFFCDQTLDDPASERVVDTKDNDRSCVLQIRTRGHSILLTGDIETNAEASLVQAYGHALHSSVLLVPHHGSKTSSSELFLEHVRPQLALFPVGWLNRYRHPHPEVSARYDRRGIRRYDTAQHGAIRVRLGATLAVDTFRTANRRYWHVP